MTPESASRYAVYFAPATTSPWRTAGNVWLGRDSETGATVLQAKVEHIHADRFSELTASARRYGFHATMKAPFRLSGGCGEGDLLAQLAQFCENRAPIKIAKPQVRMLGDFLALQVDEKHTEIATLAQACVACFEPMRAPMSAAELQRRRQHNLSHRQEELLRRWGYPYTEDAYRFHMTLTDSLAQVDADTLSRLSESAERHFDIAAPLEIDSLCIFKENAPGAVFKLLHRCLLRQVSNAAATHIV
ncbi:DUF1045 domain-containing protein [Undibacterium sp. Jales W-56]|uniref:DUF1045 domain-containing protein n=1 Tax=Undibacterium sp. Jales W-56 TaxID=2897325 RepID=UPI0021D256B5|nr:DUF1045 domain-containing protein [Undibacterium sp. Jales W-56]MCU6434912.1 DUF1045 domain-containing protein [Undibacterium sp. Jales W-56]